MDIEKILKSLKNIEPNPEYAKNSRLVILNTPQTKVVEWSLFSYLFTKRKIATVISLAAVLVVFALGGIFGNGNSPDLPGLDPISLRAEAQAIDIQIRLTGLVYENPTLVHKTTTTPSLVLDVKPDDLIILNLEGERVKDLEESSVISSEDEQSAPIDIDGILEVLSR